MQNEAMRHESFAWVILRDWQSTLKWLERKRQIVSRHSAGTCPPGLALVCAKPPIHSPPNALGP